jgi:hypothetical protein
VAGTASGGGGDSYTLTTVVPQQTVTVSSSSYTSSINMDSPFVVGDYYLVTYDGTEYLCTGGSNYNEQTYIGDGSMLWYGEGSSSAYACPFAFEHTDWNDATTLHAESGAHTIKVEHLEFVDGPLNLIAKSVTANGTYSAASDNADGYSSVMVNVPTSGGSSVQTATGTFTGNGTRTIDIACNFEPDIVYFTSDPGTTASSGTVAAIIVRDLMTATRYRNNSTTNSSYAAPGIVNMNTNGSSYSWRATYANSTVTLYCFSNGARGLLTNGRTYTYTFIKWT